MDSAGLKVEGRRSTGRALSPAAALRWMLSGGLLPPRAAITLPLNHNGFRMVQQPVQQR